MLSGYSLLYQQTGSNKLLRGEEMTAIQEAYLKQSGYNEYEIKRIAEEIKNGEKHSVFESYAFYNFENGYEAGLKADVHTDNSKVIADLRAEIGRLQGLLADEVHKHHLTKEVHKATILSYSLAEQKLEEAKELLKRCYDNYISLELLRSEIKDFLEE